MTVWILLHWEGNSVQAEGCKIEGVFRTDESAKQERAKLPRNTTFDWYEIESHEVK